MNNEKFLQVIESHFGVHKTDNTIELETWTDGGVNMFVVLDDSESNTLFEQFKSHVDDFDIDEQIDMHREDRSYKSNFTLRSSLEDFESYLNRLESITQEIELIEEHGEFVAAVHQLTDEKPLLLCYWDDEHALTFDQEEKEYRLVQWEEEEGKQVFSIRGKQYFDNDFVRTSFSKMSNDLQSYIEE